MDQLNDTQLKSVTSESRQLVILAGPGSGKTRVICHRVAHLLGHTDPSRLVVVTFTNKAAEELRVRISKLVGKETADTIDMGTFHSVCASYLRKNGQSVGIQNNFGIADEDDSKSALKKVLKEHPDADGRQLGAYKLMISRAKAHFISPQELPHDEEVIPDKRMRALITRLYVDYEEYMHENNLLDFDDILIYGLRLFEHNPNLSTNIQHVLVDEFQDTNKIQYRLVQAIAKHSQCITIVGDPDQSIYGWRAADVANITYFQKDYEDTEVVFLEQNYRSTQSIVDTSLKVIRQDKGRADKGLWTENDLGFPVQFRCFPRDSYVEQAKFIAKEIGYLIRKSNGMLDYKDFAVLYRMNRDSATIEQQLGTVDIPYKFVGGVRFFDRKEIKDVLSYLRLAVNNQDFISFTRIINVPPRTIGEATLSKVFEAAKKNNMSVMELLRGIVNETLPARQGLPRKKFIEFVSIVDEITEAIEEGRTLSQIIKVIVESTGYSEYLEKLFPKNHEDRCERIGQLQTYCDVYETKKLITFEDLRMHFSSDLSVEDLIPPTKPTDAELFESDTENLDEKSVKKEESDDQLVESQADEEEIANVQVEEKQEPEEPVERDGLAIATKFLQDIGIFATPVDKSERDKNAVTLMTLHGSKGLEFPVVFIIYAQDGSIPMFNAETPAQFDEERRLLYVGMTRAMGLLFVSCEPKDRQFRDTGTWSRFVKPLAPPTFRLISAERVDEEENPKHEFVERHMVKEISKLKRDEWSSLAKTLGRIYTPKKKGVKQESEVEIEPRVGIDAKQYDKAQEWEEDHDEEEYEEEEGDMDVGASYQSAPGFTKASAMLKRAPSHIFETSFDKKRKS